MLGLRFVLGVKNARVTLTSSGQPQRTKPVFRALAGHRSAACLLPPPLLFSGDSGLSRIRVGCKSGFPD